ncbi:uracil-DNA glycosylase [Oxalobacter vibrioformis]|uniref:Type-4 uracil-DNA glycosylase n=1 Tax=Oxalobacter vibrioformis TaxID=933080 RepID=A0A9E9LZW4_9BURK|nr:uracil-DNA glycosylase [Oxalobacter vibrioformis]WAW10278.1 uracil-DNA glycosylase [Oxalobacter vibrioformis]
MSSLKSRARILEEMGIGPEWQLRGRAAAPESVPETVTVTLDEPSPVSRAETAPDPLAGPEPGSDAWLAPTYPSEILPEPQDIASWEALVETIRGCTRCTLCETRTNTVPGVGDTSAEWLFIGEGPGYHEDQQGEPFVGRSGMLLDNMMAALGIKRGSNAYIANIVKCRASDERKKDRPPTEEEAAMCMPYLQWQIANIRPKVIIALGKTAAVGLLNTDRDITMAAMRGKVHRLPVAGSEVPLIVTYHPAYLLRTPMAKKQAWADLCLAMETIDTAG